MLYYLFLNFFQPNTLFSVLRIFRYITVRGSIALFLSFLITVFFGPKVIEFLRKYKVSQTIRKDYDYPESHQKKAGTPTMGGIIILIASVISILICSNLNNLFIVWGLFVLVAFGLIGFVDDYLKLIKKNPTGLEAKYKFIFQLIISFIVAVLIYYNNIYAAKLWGPEVARPILDYKEYISTFYTTVLTLPFLKDVFINLGIFYIPFVMIVLTGSSNAVNLTDGLDGLASGTVCLVAGTYAILSYLIGNWQIAHYLNVLFIDGAGEMAVYCAAIVGAVLGFLWFNSYPASVFMGDTGSLSIGAAIGYSAIVVKKEVLLIFAGGIFVVEALSVVIQVYSFKYRKKRVFKMAPIHHHFEKLGWKEPKIIIRFWIIGIILTLITLSTIKLQ